MRLTDNLVSQFVKITNDNGKKEEVTTAYGKVVIHGDQTYVQLDGSEILTPVTTTAEVKDDDRVAVSIQNHNAVITGNVTDPSASSDSVAGFYSEFVDNNNEIYAKVGAIDGQMSQLLLQHNEISAKVENQAGEITALTLRSNEFDVTVKSKVDSETIIASINASKEGIKINADKVTITGVVTFNDLKTPGSTVISGSNITGGTITGATLQTKELTETNGVSIGADSIKIGSAALFFDETRFALQCKKNVAFSSMGDISILSGLNSDGTSSGNGTVYVPGATLQVQKLKVINDTTIYGACSVSSGVSCTNVYASGAVSSATGYTATNGGVYVTGSITTTGGGIYAAAGNITGQNLKAEVNVNCVGLGVSGDASISGNAYIKYLYVNGTWVSSDKRLKTDIKYVDADEQSIGENGLIAPNVNITRADMIDFIEDLPIASYRYIHELEDGKDVTHYGLVVQDVLYTKVGSELVATLGDDFKTSEDPLMGYSPEKLLVFVCGALQEEIKARKALEEIVRNM